MLGTMTNKAFPPPPAVDQIQTRYLRDDVLDETLGSTTRRRRPRPGKTRLALFVTWRKEHHLNQEGDPILLEIRGGQECLV